MGAACNSAGGGSMSAQEDINKLMLHFRSPLKSDLAKTLCVDRSTISSWENRGKVPSRYMDLLSGANFIRPSTGVPESIVAAAVFHGCIFSLPAPARHHTILNSLSVVLGIESAQVHQANQGFLTSSGRFVNRTEAYYIAHRQNQILPSQSAKVIPELFSEDIW